jgi:hypothetical protein
MVEFSVEPMSTALPKGLDLQAGMSDLIVRLLRWFLVSNYHHSESLGHKDLESGERKGPSARLSGCNVGT